MSDDTSTMIDDLEARAEKLSDWECEFVSSISKQLADGKSLSIKQLAKLEMIWERIT